ncbi:Mortality factor 4-like protein 2 [Globodera pallida]|nr:Mortality factor 4-like protein 2 [Globodera pallida]
MPSRSSSVKKRQQNSSANRDGSTSSASTTPKSVPKTSSSGQSKQQQKRQNPSDSTSNGNADKAPTALTAANPHGHPPDRKWAVGEKVLCRYLNSEHIYYVAKVMFMKELSGGDSGYGIHYPGWSNRHDEVVPQHEALIRFKNFSDQEAAKAKDDVKRAQQLLNAKKRKQSDLKGRSQAQDESSRSSTPGSTENASKRKMARRLTSSVDVGAVSKKDMPQVTLPDPLRRILIDDENLVNKQFMLPKLPARITVFEIVQKYRESVVGVCEGSGGGLSPQNLERSALGLLDYFETAVGTILLYKFERPTFNDLVEELEKQKSEEAENESDAEHKGAGSELETNKPSTASGASPLAEKRICFSKRFGLPHLLRMFVRFTDMLAYTEWSERSLEAIIRHAQDFVMFLSKNHADFYDVEKDYLLAPAEYHKRVWGNHS